MLELDPSNPVGYIILGKLMHQGGKRVPAMQNFEMGAVVGFGYLAAMTVNIAINPLFPRPFRYALISAPMFVLGSLMSSVVLVALS